MTPGFVIYAVNLTIKTISSTSKKPIDLSFSIKNVLRIGRKWLNFTTKSRCSLLKNIKIIYFWGYRLTRNSIISKRNLSEKIRAFMAPGIGKKIGNYEQ